MFEIVTAHYDDIPTPDPADPQLLWKYAWVGVEDGEAVAILTLNERRVINIIHSRRNKTAEELLNRAEADLAGEEIFRSGTSTEKGRDATKRFSLDPHREQSTLYRHSPTKEDSMTTTRAKKIGDEKLRAAAKFLGLPVRPLRNEA
ncbi:hypothetical protein MYP14_16835 [Rhodococcus pyridinivorans]|uniref:hypothetical protein n=1 Tax=Rhodococcus TaxID=1827 RepID=UPI0012FE2FEB|nr:MULTISPECIES: hypothetical protein [Rhodococcus]UPK62453.1 hypothetical protein MYP14_16835 [Rhodococcus pyridinivorans]